MLPVDELSLRLVLAAIFGAAIGLERERKDWSAGMRTHMMVSLGSCLMMMVSSFGFEDILGRENVELDPSRVASQIIAGIGFIGAGTILFLKPATVLGLTTASGLWTVSGIGMATGGGMYFAAGATTVLSLIILWGMQPLQKRFSAKFQQRSLIITAKADSDAKEIVEKLFNNKEIAFINFSVTKLRKEIMIELRLEKPQDPHLLEVVKKLHDHPEIKKIQWMK